MLAAKNAAGVRHLEARATIDKFEKSIGFREVAVFATGSSREATKLASVGF